MEAAVLKGLLTKEFDSVRGGAGAGHTTICADVSTLIICALFSALLCALLCALFCADVSTVIILNSGCCWQLPPVSSLRSGH